MDQPSSSITAAPSPVDDILKRLDSFSLSGPNPWQTLEQLLTSLPVDRMYQSTMLKKLLRFVLDDGSNLQILDHLVKLGLPLDQPWGYFEYSQNTPLHNAVMQCNVEVARKLLELGANPDVKNRSGETARGLTAKCECAKAKTIRYLVESGYPYHNYFAKPPPQKHPNLSRPMKPLAPFSADGCPFPSTASDLARARQDVAATEDGRVKVFSVPNLLTKEECEWLVKQATEAGYQSVDWEYNKEYRDCDRVVMKSKELSDLLWARLRPFIARKDVENVRPFGFGNDGTWVPTGVNECVRFTRYQVGGHFQPHRDGPFVIDDHNKSVYTLQVYLNEGMEGGHTLFYADPAPNQGPQIVGDISPSTGTALVFNHDGLHKGDVVTSGAKYILRTDIMFHRVSTSVSRDLRAYEQDPVYQESMHLFDLSIKLQAEGDAKGSTEAFVRAVELQAQLHSIPPQAKPDALSLLPRESFSNILSFLPFRDIPRLGMISRAWLSATRDPQFWMSLFAQQWPRVVHLQEQRALSSVRACASDSSAQKEEQFIDWYTLFRDRYKADSDFQIIFVDMGLAETRFGMIGHPREGVMQSAVARVRGHYWAAGSGSEDYLVGEELDRSWYASRAYDSQHLYSHESAKSEKKLLDPTCIRNIFKYVIAKGFGAHQATQHPLLISVPSFWTNGILGQMYYSIFEKVHVPYLATLQRDVAALWGATSDQPTPAQSGIVVSLDNFPFLTATLVHNGEALLSATKEVTLLPAQKEESGHAVEIDMQDMEEVVSSLHEKISSCEDSEIRDLLSETMSILLIRPTNDFDELQTVLFSSKLQSMFPKCDVLCENASCISTGLRAFASLSDAKSKFFTPEDGWKALNKEPAKVEGGEEEVGFDMNYRARIFLQKKIGVTPEGYW